MSGRKRIILIASGAAFACAAIAVAFVARTQLHRFDVVDDAPPAGAGVPEARARPGPFVDSETSWPCWRGPGRDNVSPVTGIRKDWSGGLRKVWQVDYLCQGRSNACWSAPVIRGNRLVVTGRDDANDLVFALDPGTGELIWKGSYAAEAGSAHGRGARATPAIDGDSVYTFGRSGDLARWRLGNGELVWKRDVEDEGGEGPSWGHASSPLVIGDKVIVQGGGSCRTIAYDKETGGVAWKSSRGTPGYAAPALMHVGDRPLVVAFHGEGVAGLDPADGRVEWDLPWKTSHGANATTPVASQGVLFVTSGYGKGCQAIAVSESGAEVLWKGKGIASHHSDPFVIDGFVYGYSGQSYQNRGLFKCIELATGVERWRTKEVGWGTAVAVDGHFVCLDIDGNLFLVRADPDGLVKVTEFRGAVPGVRNPVWTIPVVLRGRIYLRHKRRLICYDLTG